MDLQNKIITVTDVNSAVTASGKKSTKIKDNDGLTYTIWETKADNTQTQAHQQYAQLGNVLNQTYNISYTEKKMESGTGYFRNIMQFGAKLPNSPQNTPESPVSTYKAPQKDIEDNIRWCNALNNASLLIAHGKTNDEKDTIESVANYIYRLKPSTEATTEQPAESVPMPEKEDEIKVPF